MKRTVSILFTIIVLAACAPSTPIIPTAPQDPLAEEGITSITFTSDAFTQGQPIPGKYTCKGENISPALAWGEPPVGTQSFALIMEDPDAPGNTWVHWLLFNIPASSRGLPEAIASDATLPDGSMSGNSSFGKPGYDGPCPPSGTHHYVFKLYALDEMLAISAGADKGELEKAMVGHILAQGELTGIFGQ